MKSASVIVNQTRPNVAAPEESRPAFLVLDTSYTLEIIRERGLESAVLCRDLDGFFRHVWSVHPFATLLTSEDWTSRFGKPVTHELGDRHTFIEGKVGRFKWLSRIFPLNFLISQVSLFFSLRRLIKREGIKAIRVGDPAYLGLFGLALSRSTGVPFLIRVSANNDDVRANTGTPMFPRLFRTVKREKKVEHYVFPRADMVAGPSQDNVDYALANGARPDRVTIFPYGNLLSPEHLLDPAKRGLDHALFARLGLTPGRYLLSVARLQPLKHPEDIMTAFATARAAGHDVDLAYAGDGELRPLLEEQARTMGISDRVHFIGNQNQSALAQLNAHAAAVVSPLTGRALSESALGGAPIVAYDLDWQGQLIETGKTGELVPYREIDLLGAGLIRLLADPEYAGAMGRAVRERALDMLDPRRLNDHERAQYTRLMSLARER